MSDWRDDLPAVRGKLLRDEPLGPFTWFRVGGAAELLFLPADHEDLAAFLRGSPASVPVNVGSAAPYCFDFGSALTVSCFLLIVKFAEEPVANE